MSAIAPSALRVRLDRTLDQVFSSIELDDALHSGRKLRVKWGVDCTAPELHLGHAVNLWALRALQDAGHVVVLLLGDTTTRIGDPTGRDRTRPVIPPAEIARNAAGFLEQAGLILRTEPAVLEVRRNSEWYDAMSATELLALLSEVTHARLMSRDMFRRRLSEGHDIAVHELSYPVLQSYDSCVIDSDLAMAGTDQLFNEMLAREFQQRRGMRPQVVMTTRITPGIDGGEKQSKSLGNYIALTDPAREKFGKAMSLPDELIGDYLEVYTEVPIARVTDVRHIQLGGGRDVRDAKLELAEAIVARYHGADIAAAERAWFRTAFSGVGTPDDVPELWLEAPPLSALELVRAARPDLSGAEGRRLLAQRGVRLGDVVLDDPRAALTPADGELLRIGRRHWFRVRH